MASADRCTGLTVKLGRSLGRSFPQSKMREQSRRAVICGMLAYMRIVLLICGLAATRALMASDAYPPPRFTDPQRVKKLEAAMPEVDRILRSYATEKKIPGIVCGVL